jgi:hypothetical protein
MPILVTDSTGKVGSALTACSPVAGTSFPKKALKRLCVMSKR